MAAHPQATQATALKKLYSLSYRPKKEDKREGGLGREEGGKEEGREVEGWRRR